MANSEKINNENIKQCSLCQNNEVSIVITTIDKDGKVLELSLCQVCADKKGVGKLNKTIVAPQEILAELRDKIPSEDHHIVCSDCGLSYANFRKHGRLGCEHCYDAFGTKLEAIIKQIHGTTTHTGKAITNGKKKITERFIIKNLRTIMKNAIKNEDYERAAAVRDKIYKMKQASKKPS